MTDPRVQLAELSTNLFAIGAKSSDDTRYASKKIIKLYHTISDLDEIFKELASWRTSSPYTNARQQWKELLNRITYVAPSQSSQASLDTSDLGREISWTKMQLVLNELQFLAASLRLENRLDRRGDDDSDRKALVEYPRIKQTLDENLRQLQKKAPSAPSKPAPPSRPPPYPPKLPPAPDTDKLRQENEDLWFNEAQRQNQLGNFKEAQKIYLQLSASTKSKNAALKYDYGAADVLSAQKEWSQAEDLSRTVHIRSKILYGNDHELTRNSQRVLCVSLRSQGTTRKLLEAQTLYLEVWDQSDSIRKLQAGDKWILENGLGLGQVFEEQRFYQQAEEQYEKLWSYSPEAALLYSKLLVRCNEGNKARRTLKKCFSSPDATVRDEASKLAFEVGKTLYDQGSWTDAEPLLQLAWSETKNRPQMSSRTFSGGFCLSRVLYVRSEYQQAKSVLEQLRATRIADSNSSPTDLHIDALLAWVYRQLNDLSHAESFAQHVWDQAKDRDILGPSLSTGVNLIWISSKKGDTKKRAALWQEVSKVGAASNRSRDDLKATVQSWRALADDLDRFARARGHEDGTKTSKSMRSEATALERRHGL